MYDVRVRPISFERLLQFTAEELTTRGTTAEEDLEQCQAQLKDTEDVVEKLKELVIFLERERSKVTLAQELQRGTKVRVVCPSCKGSGQKNADVTSGRIQTGSAFEGFGKAVVSEDPRSRCLTCEGKRWTLMDRYID